MITQEINLEEQWAALEFADVELHDARLNRRCQELAGALGQQPTAYINQACEDWAATKGAYRFFDNAKKVTPARISAPHQQRTMDRMSQYPLVLAVQDTTFFNYSHHPQTEGLGDTSEVWPQKATATRFWAAFDLGGFSKKLLE